MSRRLATRYHRKFMTNGFEMILNYIEETLSARKPVINFSLPNELKKKVDFSIGEEPTTPEYLLQQCKLVMEHQVRPHHPHFHNQLFGGFDQYAVLGNLMTTCMNGTMFTYEVAPCFSIMEENIYEHLRKRVGWDQIDGMMTPGGSFANWNGMLLARYKRFPESKNKGIQGLPPLKILTSVASHYSITKGAILEGIGIDHMIKIKVDDNGRMCPEAFEEEVKNIIERGEVPYFANITAGTSVGGAIDPVERLSGICKKYGIWAHLDAALGGAFFMSDKLRSKIGDCSNIDSITWDPHKALVVPLQATFILCKYPGLMQSCNSTKADVLFHKFRTSYDLSLDTGDKSLQCGRVIDILKCWTYFKGNGWKDIAAQVEREHELATYLTERVKNSNGKWILVYPTDTFNVSYYYVPEDMRELPRTDNFYKTLSKINVSAKKLMIDEGKVLIGYATNGKNDNYFWRNVMSNPFINEEDVDFELDCIERYCKTAHEDLKAGKA